MNEFQKDYLLKRQDYGVLYPYVMEETVTDIHWNGRQLWIDDLEKGRYMAPEILSESRFHWPYTMQKRRVRFSDTHPPAVPIAEALS